MWRGFCGSLSGLTLACILCYPASAQDKKRRAKKKDPSTRKRVCPCRPAVLRHASLTAILIFPASGLKARRVARPSTRPPEDNLIQR